VALIDPLAAALDALLAHLAGIVTSDDHTVRTRRGWPEHNVKLALGSDGPILIAVAGQPDDTPTNPRPLGLDGEDTLYRVALRTFPVQLRLLTGFRIQLDELVPAVDRALSNKLPSSPDLWISSTDYHSRPLTFARTRFERGDDKDSAKVGEWEATWSLRCTTDLVLPATHPTLTELVGRFCDARTGAEEDSTVFSAS